MIEAAMLWNEPNNMSHWDAQMDPDWSLFARMARLAGEAIRADMLPPDIGSANAAGVSAADGTEVLSLPLREAREIFERKYLESQVSRFGGNISRTASFVGMERSALHRKLRSLGITGSERGDKIE